MKTALPSLDALDRRIVDLLTVDARVSNRQIAAQLGVTEGTIRGRINRLEEGGAIRLTAVTNVAFAGSPKVVLIGIQAQHGELKTVRQKIAAMPEIGCVIVMLGRFDILAIGLFAALEDIVEVANNRILSLPGRAARGDLDRREDAQVRLPRRQDHAGATAGRQDAAGLTQGSRTRK